MTPSRTIPDKLYKDAELYCFKLLVEDEIKANPLSELAKHVTRPFVAKEPEIPP